MLRSDELRGIELGQRDDAHARQGAGESIDVGLKIVDGQAPRLQGGQLGVEELAEAQHAHPGPGVEQALDLGDVVAVVRTQQDVVALAGQSALGQGVEGALDADVDDLLLDLEFHILDDCIQEILK